MHSVAYNCANTKGQLLARQARFRETSILIRLETIRCMRKINTPI